MVKTNCYFLSLDPKNPQKPSIHKTNQQETQQKTQQQKKMRTPKNTTKPPLAFWSFKLTRLEGVSWLNFTPLTWSKSCKKKRTQRNNPTKPVEQVQSVIVLFFHFFLMNNLLLQTQFVGSSWSVLPQFQTLKKTKSPMAMSPNLGRQRPCHRLSMLKHHRRPFPHTAAKSELPVDAEGGFKQQLPL